MQCSTELSYLPETEQRERCCQDTSVSSSRPASNPNRQPFPSAQTPLRLSVPVKDANHQDITQTGGEPTDTADASQPLLSIKGLRTHFPVRTGLLARVTDHVRAVDGVSFDLGAGETLGLVGESGCGKTTVGRTLLGLIPAAGGRVIFEGVDVLMARGVALRRLRRDMQIIFQDPAGSLDPRMRVWQIVTEPMRVHGDKSGRAALREAAAELVTRCELPASVLDRYPHEFSGGQRQRIGIARALALKPKFIICDEPTSALDVSVQAQIINLLTDLQRDMGLSYLFISHDMAVVQHMCPRIAVMYAGKIVEQGTREQIVNDPQHPYTRKLLSAVPRMRVPG
jgi:peptide/nickel transport system ATP-binding protein